MSLPDLLHLLLESHGSTLQDLALLHYLKHGEGAIKPLQCITALKVCDAACGQLRSGSREAEIDALRSLAIVNVASFVKENPRARPQELQMAVAKEIQSFVNNLNKLI